MLARPGIPIFKAPLSGRSLAATQLAAVTGVDNDSDGAIARDMWVIRNRSPDEEMRRQKERKAMA
jgi:hypothetical protein